MDGVTIKEDRKESKQNGDWTGWEPHSNERSSEAWLPQELDVALRQFVRARPLVAISAFVAGGFILGRLGRLS